MSIDLSDPQIQDAVDTFYGPKEYDWIVLGYSAQRVKLLLLGAGLGGLSSLQGKLQEVGEDVAYGLLREGRMVSFVTYIGEKTGGVKRARAMVHGRLLSSRLFHPHDATFTVSSPSEITRELLPRDPNLAPPLSTNFSSLEIPTKPKFTTEPNPSEFHTSPLKEREVPRSEESGRAIPEPAASSSFPPPSTPPASSPPPPSAQTNHLTPALEFNPASSSSSVSTPASSPVPNSASTPSSSTPSASTPNHSHQEHNSRPVSHPTLQPNSPRPSSSPKPSTSTFPQLVASDYSNPVFKEPNNPVARLSSFKSNPPSTDSPPASPRESSSSRFGRPSIPLFSNFSIKGRVGKMRSASSGNPSQSWQTSEGGLPPPVPPKDVAPRAVDFANLPIAPKGSNDTFSNLGGLNTVDKLNVDTVHPVVGGSNGGLDFASGTILENPSSSSVASGGPSAQRKSMFGHEDAYDLDYQGSSNPSTVPSSSNRQPAPTPLNLSSSLSRPTSSAQSTGSSLAEPSNRSRYPTSLTVSSTTIPHTHPSARSVSAPITASSFPAELERPKHSFYKSQSPILRESFTTFGAYQSKLKEREEERDREERLEEVAEEERPRGATSGGWLMDREERMREEERALLRREGNGRGRKKTEKEEVSSEEEVFRSEEERALAAQEAEQKEKEAEELRLADEGKQRQQDEVDRLERIKDELRAAKSSGGILADGWLTVQPPGTLIFRRRFFHILSSRILLFKDSTNISTPLNTIELPLENIQLSDAYEEIQVLHSFRLADRTGEIWLCYLDSEGDKTVVVEAIKIAAS